MSPHGEARLVTEERWHHISRLVNEAFGKSETRMLALRKRIIARFKRKLSDGEVLDRPPLEHSLPRERPASAARQRRPRPRPPRG